MITLAWLMNLDWAGGGEPDASSGNASAKTRYYSQRRKPPYGYGWRYIRVVSACWIF